MELKVVANQPYYFARVHWWERALRGTLVVLDDVLRSPVNPPNRTVVFDGVEERYLTLPIGSKYRMSPINEAEVSPWGADHQNKITAYFKKAPFKNEALDVFSKVRAEAEAAVLAIDVILASVRVTASELGIPLTMHRSSQMDLKGTKRSARMIRACRLLGSSVLVLGKGSVYLEEDQPLYEEARVEVEIQDWPCPVPNRSILDAIAWHGKGRVREVLGLQ
jgi:hypothetical protein